MDFFYRDLNQIDHELLYWLIELIMNFYYEEEYTSNMHFAESIPINNLVFRYYWLMMTFEWYSIFFTFFPLGVFLSKKELMEHNICLSYRVDFLYLFYSILL